jgi:hypothetical protein
MKNDSICNRLKKSRWFLFIKDNQSFGLGIDMQGKDIRT